MAILDSALLGTFGGIFFHIKSPSTGLNLLPIIAGLFSLLTFLAFVAVAEVVFYKQEETFKKDYKYKYPSYRSS
jgi:hypothetical protein